MRISSKGDYGLRALFDRDGLSPTVPEGRALVQELWGELRGTILSVLAAITLDDLCQRRRQSLEQSMYYI